MIMFIMKCMNDDVRFDVRSKLKLDSFELDGSALLSSHSHWLEIRSRQDLHVISIRRVCCAPRRPTLFLFFFVFFLFFFCSIRNQLGNSVRAHTRCRFVNNNNGKKKDASIQLRTHLHTISMRRSRTLRFFFVQRVV